jgi:hypothetical protein
MPSVTNNPRLHCIGQAKSFSVQDLSDLINNQVDSPNCGPDDQIRMFGSQDTILVQDLIDLILLGSSSNIALGEYLRAGGQGGSVAVADVVASMGATVTTEEVEN